MSMYFKQIETVRLPDKVSAPFPCETSENGQISIVTFNCLLILHPYPSKDNTSPSISMKKVCIQPSNFALSSNVDIDINNFIEDLSKDDMFEAVLRTELSAQLTTGLSVENKIIKAAWSPSRLVDDYDCAIATLSNTNSLEICIKTYDNSYYEEYLCVCNITQKYIEARRTSWTDVSGRSSMKQFSELKARVDKIRPTAFAWSHIINKGENQFCILVVGHYSGSITFWKVNALKSSNLLSVNITLLAETTISLKHITVLLWKEAENKALIFIGNFEGKAVVLTVNNISEDNLSLDQELVLWPEADLIRIEHLTLLAYQNHIFLFLVKGSDLIIYLINGSGENVDTCVFHVGNLIITGIQQIGANKILIVSLSGAIKELKVSCANQKINIEWRHIYININWYVNQCLGVIVSKNRIFFGFLTGPSKTADSKDDRVQYDLAILSNTEKDALEVLLSNPSKSFQDYWDCLEVFRVNCLLEKQFPCEKFNTAKYDELSFYDLKLHVWASKIFETVCDVATNVSNYMKPHDEFLQILSIRMVIFRMNFLLKLNASGASLSTFQLQNLLILNNYLKQVVLEDMIPKLELGDQIISDILEVMSIANDLAYPRPPSCWTCGEDILNLSCFPLHFNMRCAISFMQISKYPCYRCLFCKCLVHEDIDKEVPVVLCPICEVPMPKTRIDIIRNIDREFRTKKLSESCKSDCVRSVLKPSSIEEHAFVNENK